jgi:hypothetical protein
MLAYSNSRSGQVSVPWRYLPVGRILPYRLMVAAESLACSSTLVAKRCRTRHLTGTEFRGDPGQCLKGMPELMPTRRDDTIFPDGILYLK